METQYLLRMRVFWHPGHQMGANQPTSYKKKKKNADVCIFKLH